MSEGKAGGVQELPTENREFGFADRELRRCPVESVADNRMFEGGEVHADLMRAPGMKLDFKKRGGAEFLKNCPVGARDAGVLQFAGRTGGHSYAALEIACDGKLDSASRGGEFTLHESKIGFVDGARAEVFGKFGVSEIVFGNENGTAGVFVEAVNDTGTQKIFGLRERLAASEKRVDERAARTPCSSVDGHSGGLIDDDEIVVLVENVERNGFGFGFERQAWFGLDGNAFGTLESLTGLCGVTVDEDEGGIDEFLDTGTGQVRTVGDDETVEASAGVGRRRKKFDPFGRGF